MYKVKLLNFQESTQVFSSIFRSQNQLTSLDLVATSILTKILVAFRLKLGYDLYMIKLHSPNGQFGCLWIRFGTHSFTLGFLPSTFGADYAVGSKIVWAFPKPDPCL